MCDDFDAASASGCGGVNGFACPKSVKLDAAGLFVLKGDDKDFVSDKEVRFRWGWLVALRSYLSPFAF